MNKFSIYTLGCKVNQAESDWIASELSGRGFEQVGFEGDPDFCIINTCTVTKKSDKKSRQVIRRANKKSCKVIVTGCFVVFNQDFLVAEGVDWVPNPEKEKIPKIIEEVGSCSPAEGIYKSHARPLVKIQDGCEQFCSYCIVPLVRGKYKSIPVRAIIEKIKSIDESGYGEAVLTGIHIGKYGAETGKSNGLANLLEDILKQTGIKRIRLSSIEINEISRELVDIVKGSRRVAPHLHIPLQSGSDRILKLMGRPYSSRQYLEKIREVQEGMALTTDIMVGFPGETEADFKHTLGIAEEIEFSKLHVFQYSPRKHTKAYSMEGQVAPAVKKARSKKLISAGRKLRERFLQSNIGKILDVVCETRHGGTGWGTSGNYIKVFFPVERNWGEGKIIKVRINSMYKNGLWGKMYKN